MFSNQLAWSISAASAQQGDAEIHPQDERLTGDAADFKAHVQRELFNSSFNKHVCFSSLPKLELKYSRPRTK